MANPTNAVGSYTRTGVHLSLVATISAVGVTTFEHHLRSGGIFLPKPDKQLVEWGMTGSGVAMHDDENITLGRANPNFSFVCPVTTSSAAILYGSVMQGETYASTKYSLALPTAPLCSQFMHIEGGWTGAFYKALGCVAKSVKLVIPPVDDTLGQPTLEAQIMGANAERLAALSLAATTADSGAYKKSSEYYFKLATSSYKLVSGEITIDNGLTKGPNIGATPDAMFIGKYTVRGSVKVLLTSSASDEFDLLSDNHDAGTPIELELGVSGHHFIRQDVFIESPTLEEQGGAVIASFSFREAYVDTNSTLIEVNSATDILNWA